MPGTLFCEARNCRGETASLLWCCWEGTARVSSICFALHLKGDDRVIFKIVKSEAIVKKMS